MWGVASKPKRFSNGDDFVEGSSVGGRVVYTDSSTAHGLIVSPLWYTARSWDSAMTLDDKTENGYGMYRVLSESDFNTYIRPMLNNTQSNYLPFNVYSGWPASKQGISLWWTSDEVDANTARAYSQQSDGFITVQKSTQAVLAIFRTF
jgi:hypothetical protein